MIYDWLKMALISGAICLFGAGEAQAQAQAAVTHQQFIDANTRPIGEVNVAGESLRATAVSAAMSPKQRYEASCAFCHDTGTAGSPKLGAKAAWSPRLAQGTDTLVKHAISGIGTMPAKGMCPSCSDDEIAAAVHYMIDQVQ